MRAVACFAILCFLFSCGDGNKNKSYLPKSTGASGDIVVVIDSAQWKGEVGEALRDVLSRDVEGLPREEPRFNIIKVNPGGSIGILNQIRNLMYVFTLDQNTPGARQIVQGFTPETIEQIKSDTSYYIYTEKDVNARGQEVIYLFGQTQELLVKHIRQKGLSLVDYLNNIERQRLEEKLFKTRTTENISQFMQNELQCAMSIPYGYKVADKQKDFVWFRQIEVEVDKNVWLTWKPYESEYQMLPDSLIAWRDATAKKYLFEDPENLISYLMTETEVPFNPVVAKQSKVGEHYAMELRGLWRTNNKSMGGPFISYALVDQDRGLLYYIEGFTFSPGKPQREIIRELEAILKTFQTSSELKEEK